ncbi:MAG: dephospho-CoA kinase [Bacteroidia bacterium]|nr:dephospho-CoA kinase [Bacteroidia bacterium]
MLKIGITGGIGSGKTTVCKMFHQLGVPVYSADERGKELMLEEPIRTQLIEAFGTESYSAEGSLNTKHLSDIVFQDPAKLQKINAIVHPVVFNDFTEWCNKQTAPYVIKEAAIMLETVSRLTVDKIILVYAPKELRLQRVADRDGSTNEEILNRMSKQMPEEEKIKLVQYIIYNDGTASLTDQVNGLHRLFISRSLILN